MALVADSERDRAVGLLRQSYVQGRLSFDELSERVSLALGARTHWELGSSLSGLPGAHSPLVAAVRAHPVAQSVGHAAARAVTFVALGTLWAFVSSMLLASYVVVAIVGDAPAVVSLAFLFVWVLLSWGVWRAWRAGARRPQR